MFTIQLNPKHNIMLELIAFLSSFASFDPKHNNIQLDPKMLYSNKSSLMICVLINCQSVELVLTLLSRAICNGRFSHQQEIIAIFNITFLSTPIKKKLSKLINLGSARTLAGKIIPHRGCESLQVAKCNEILHPVTQMKFKTSKLVLKFNMLLSRLILHRV